MSAKIKSESETNILDEFLDIAKEEANFNMNLPLKQNFKLIRCPNCKEISAFQMPSLSSNCLYVCEWCEFEF